MRESVPEVLVTAAFHVDVGAATWRGCGPDDELAGAVDEVSSRVKSGTPPINGATRPSRTKWRSERNLIVASVQLREQIVLGP